MVFNNARGKETEGGSHCKLMLSTLVVVLELVSKATVSPAMAWYYDINTLPTAVLPSSSCEV